MSTIKSYTDLEQSKKLAEILPLESADMYWKNGVSDNYIQCFTPFVMDSTNMDYDYDVPCWSLAALLDVLPVLNKIGYKKAKPYIHFNVFINKWVCESLYYTSDSYDNPVDAAFEMIVWLKEHKKL